MKYNLIASVDNLPLAFEERLERPAAPSKDAAGSAERSFVSRLGAEVWSEISQLVVTCKAEMEKIREQIQNIE